MGIIQNNAITGNSMVGIRFSASPTALSNNNIYSNTLNVALTIADNVDAANNWWGTTDAQAINQTIYDNKNSNTLGRVNFVPFLSAPNPSAPSIQNVTITPFQTPTPPPTSPTQTPTPSEMPNQTPTPTPASTPGSPLSVGSSFAETIAQFDIMGLAKIVIIALAIMWVIIILVSVDRKFGKKK